MNTWSSGYVTEIDYQHAYHKEISPQMLSLALLNRSISTYLNGKQLRYLELGYGQGLSLNIHAAACPGEYWGTDFNPSHAANARELAEASGANTHIFDLSFAELANLQELPEFDIIAMHGIWSWISAENREVIVELLRHKLAICGTLYVSYNCMPGWAPAIPLRQLMNLHAELAGSQNDGIANRISAALAFTQKVVDAGARYFEANPGEAARLQRITNGNRNYLAHEYFNSDWHPMLFAEVNTILSRAKVEFAASATLLDQLDMFCFKPAGQELLAGISHPVLRETVGDFLANQMFRRDIYVKGVRKVTSLEQQELLLEQGFVLIKSPHDFPMRIMGKAGEVTLQENQFRSLIAVLQENNFAPKTVAELVAHPTLYDIPLLNLFMALIILTGTGYSLPIQHKDAVIHAKPHCAALNLHLCNKARSSGDITTLASPVLGGGVPVGQLQQLMLLARTTGLHEPKEWATYVWKVVHSQGRKVQKDGQPLQTEEDNLAELMSIAEEFAAHELPILQALGVSDI